MRQVCSSLSNDGRAAGAFSGGCFLRTVLALRLAGLLLYCRLLTLMPVQLWTSWLGFQRLTGVGHSISSPDFPDYLWTVPGYVEKISMYAPWRNRCLPAAVATAIELRRLGVRSILVLGVQWQPPKAGAGVSILTAHAWLCVGRMIVCGREGLKRHIPLVAWVAQTKDSGSST